MSNELIAFERQLNDVKNQFGDVLGGRMPPDRLIRTVVMSCTRNPDLLQCNRQSLMNAAMTFGVLALEVDGVTGQGYVIPFKKVAQPVIGYKGFNTIGARSGLTITASVVRENDAFDFDKGSKAFVEHKPSLAGGGRIIAAWAVAAANGRPPIIEVIGIDELMAVKSKSPGAKKSDSPWNDPAIGFPAMCEKTARRRLARSTPMNWAAPEFQYAAVMDEAFEERGRHSYIAPGIGPVIEGQAAGGMPERSSDTPLMGDVIGPKDSPEIAALKIEGKEAAALGVDVLQKWWARLSPRQRVELADLKDKILKPAAIAADKDGVQ